MKTLPGMAVALLTGLACAGGVQANVISDVKLANANRTLHGRVLDFTKNHHHDKRIWSPALGERRDLYVYVPPAFDPNTHYPMAIFLHGANLDEQFFLRVIPLFDRAICEGKVPPVIVAAPDGSLQGRISWFCSASWWANTRAGRFEDFVMEDVWNFLVDNFPIRPEREAHAIIGVSMGGAGAFALAMRHKDRVKMAVGFAPALNLRWVDCHGRYNSPFDPDCWGWREKPRPFEVIGRPAMQLPMRYHTLFRPVVGCGPDSLAELARINPAEIMASTDLRPGELDLYLTYGGKDEFNIGAQVESFLALAKCRGVHVEVDFDPEGRHDFATGARMFPRAIAWVAPRVAPFGPVRYQP